MVSILLSSLLFSSQLCGTLCYPMDCSSQASLSFTISWILPRLVSIVLVMPSSHHILRHYGLQIILEQLLCADYFLAIPFCQILFYHKCMNESRKAKRFYRLTGPIIFMMRELFLLYPRKITGIIIGHLVPVQHVTCSCF